MNEVRVNRKAAGRIASGHPWIFDSDVADRDGAQQQDCEPRPGARFRRRGRGEGVPMAMAQAPCQPGDPVAHFALSNPHLTLLRWKDSVRASFAQADAS